MQTRRDQLQAYQFAMGRLATALVSGDPGMGESPTRRSALGTLFSAGIAVLLCAGFWVYGLVSPGGNTSWRQAGSIIVEEETGNRYLYLGGELRPVRNYASALLIAGNGATVQSVSRNSLAGVRHGAPVGIAEAPDSVPAASALLSGVWNRCLRPDVSGGQVLDFDPADRSSAIPDNRRVLLSAPGGTPYLLWHGTKYRVPSRAALIALGLDDQQPLAAPKNWLSAVPTGVTLAPADIPGLGKTAGKVAGHAVTVGQLFESIAGGVDHHYVMRSDGVAPISATESALLAAQPGAAVALRMDASDIAVTPVSSDRTMMKRLPDVLNVRTLDAAESVICLRQRTRGESLRNEVVVESGAAASGARHVLIPPGGGVLAVEQAQSSPQSATQRMYLINEQGMAYPLANDQARQALGYGRASALPLPEAVLGLLRRGPVLSTPVAAATVRGG
ncbi:type VII secretion protein EccB [Streptomyces sp. NBC_01525]|uniref:type VII secretion protein EccB n=1 Tax=Streptomyces sp. NBC_01525 TaxID=2903893 RepID=UPI0038638B3A